MDGPFIVPFTHNALYCAKTLLLIPFERTGLQKEEKELEKEKEKQSQDMIDVPFLSVHKN